KRGSHVIVNMAVSVDGRINTRTRERFALGSETDRRLMDVLRERADAVLIGSGTVRYDGHPMLLRYPDLVAKRIRRGEPAHPANVVLSGDLDLPLRPFFVGGKTKRIIFTTRRAGAAQVRRFEKVAEVIVLPGKEPSPERVIEELRKRDLNKLILEGGGGVHFPFAKAGLVDEWYVTITPRLIGGRGAPSFLDGEGFLKRDHIQLKLVSSRRIGDELFLRYRRKS
ncbi:MAG TPA: dihydrofolate reductase family protein, partial [Candidatus Krumholzibacteria bacterium]|nr:dihydrofolate reductase family protein [Candidatus Krumholzibacteria bacterium]